MCVQKFNSRNMGIEGCAGRQDGDGDGEGETVIASTSAVQEEREKRTALIHATEKTQVNECSSIRSRNRNRIRIRIRIRIRSLSCNCVSSRIHSQNQ
jgi:hypothetical protein